MSALRAVVPDTNRLSVTLNLAHVDPASSSHRAVAAAAHVDAAGQPDLPRPDPARPLPAASSSRTRRHLTDWSFVHDGDLEVIWAPIDVLGVNYYTPGPSSRRPSELRRQASGRWVNDPSQSDAGPSPWPGTDLAYAIPQSGPYTDMGWPIAPETFTGSSSACTGTTPRSRW